MSEPIDISGYLLGELSGAELEEAERLIREDPELGARVESLRPVVGELESLPSEAWRELHPPPLVLEGAAPADSPGAAPAKPEARRRRGWWPQQLTLRPLTVALASLAILAVGLGAGVLIGGDPASDDVEATLALDPVPPRGEQASGSAELIGTDRSEAVIDVSGLSTSEPGEFYELWLLSSPDDLVSVGSFKVGESGAASVRVPLPVDPDEFEFFDLSIERTDGDASHSGRSVLRGPTSSA
ncbi:MAG TPA: anti-sigma factor [Solirubrobacterales bacterium]|nr:anti-sigma factor [Solirubrobacterales bacterium]